MNDIIPIHRKTDGPNTEAGSTKKMFSLLRQAMASFDGLLVKDVWLEEELRQLNAMLSTPIASLDLDLLQKKLQAIAIHRDSTRDLVRISHMEMKHSMLNFIESLEPLYASLNFGEASLHDCRVKINDTHELNELLKPMASLRQEINKLASAADTLQDHINTASIETEVCLQTIDELRFRLDEAEHLIVRDPLTGALNRRGLEDAFHPISSAAMRTSRNFCVALADLDYFKKINDTYGHPTGDAILIYFASQLQAILRPADIIARYGGEEFAIILPESSAEQARVALERVRHHIKMHPYRHKGKVIEVTVSIGIKEFERGDTMGQMFSIADQALYQAKASGRDRIVIAS